MAAVIRYCAALRLALELYGAHPCELTKPGKAIGIGDEPNALLAVHGPEGSRYPGFGVGGHHEGLNIVGPLR